VAGASYCHTQLHQHSPTVNLRTSPNTVRRNADRRRRGDFLRGEPLRERPGEVPPLLRLRRGDGLLRPGGEYLLLYGFLGRPLATGCGSDTASSASLASHGGEARSCSGAVRERGECGENVRSSAIRIETWSRWPLHSATPSSAPSPSFQWSISDRAVTTRKREGRRGPDLICFEYAETSSATDGSCGNSYEETPLARWKKKLSPVVFEQCTWRGSWALRGNSKRYFVVPTDTQQLSQIATTAGRVTHRNAQRLGSWYRGYV